MIALVSRRLKKNLISILDCQRLIAITSAAGNKEIPKSLNSAQPQIVVDTRFNIRFIGQNKANS